MLLIIKLLLIVAALIIFLRLKLDLILSVALSAILAVLLFGIHWHKAVAASAEILLEAKTFQLLVVVIMVLYLGAVLKEKKMVDRLISSLNCFIRDKRIVALVGPAILGFLPTPGGALMSAPLVEESTRTMNVKPEFNSFINYWFRHLWEFVWPVYAGLLLFQTMSEIPLKKIVLYQSPFTVLNIATGLAVVFIYFKRHQIRRLEPENRNNLIGTVRDFFAGVWPILLVILLFFILSLPLYLSLTGVSVILTLVTRMKPREIVNVVFSRFILKTLLLIAMVMIFQKMISISEAFEILKTWDISPGMVVLFAFFVSFTMGFLTGVNIAFIAIAYPILLPLIQNLPNFFYLSLYVYIIGFVGVLLSPLHLCLVLTNAYFKSSLYRVYQLMLVPAGILIAAATVLVLIL